MSLKREVIRPKVAIPTSNQSMASENMLLWNDIDFSQVLPTPFVALAMVASTSGANQSNSVPDIPALETLPTELLIRIVRQLSPADQIKIAFVVPHLFMNSDRFHIFFDDANYQLNIPTYSSNTSPEKLDQWPLILEAIASRVSLEQIGRMLDLYEELCIARQVDPHVFLNSDFPDNRPSSMAGPDTPMVLRNLLTPLHVAIVFQRKDVIQHLIDRGANIRQEVLGISGRNSLNPLQYAILLISTWERRFDEASPFLKFICEDIALGLLLTYFPEVSAYTDDHQALTPEMRDALLGGSDRLVTLFLERAETSANEFDDVARLARQNLRNLVLERILNSGFPMPDALRYILRSGAQITQTISFLNGTWDSMTFAGVMNQQVEHAAIGFRWEWETGSQTLHAAAQFLLGLTASDAFLHLVLPLAQVLIDLNDVDNQVHLLVNSIKAGQEAFQIRNWLLSNTKAAGGVALRFSIILRDRTSTAFIIERFIRAGENIDAQLPLNSPHSPANNVDDPHRFPYWYANALTFSLAERNYHSAAQLLSVGAAASLVPTNIKHRVRKTRDRLSSGLILNPVHYIFKGIEMPDGSEPTKHEAIQAFTYVFTHILDNPAAPLPPYPRQRRNPVLPTDHPQNDSDDDVYYSENE
ncbi:hypothetical protein F5Y03DRAFT_403064 [Xylaria venustula]|nr:hypothetical protein F5Y03DRAFT_403064 [Xylaria venustula]